MHVLRTIQAVAVLGASYVFVAAVGVVAISVIGVATILSAPFSARTA